VDVGRAQGKRERQTVKDRETKRERKREDGNRE
jgi:hypothetical protein